MEKEIIRIAKESIEKAIINDLTGYQKPLSKYINKVLEKHESEFTSLIDCEVVEILNAKTFKTTLSEALNMKLAKVLVNKLGGELEKKVNELKANPQTRAKITLAISNIINEI